MGDIENAVIRVVSSIADIPADAWDACARGADKDPNAARPENPFLSHAFLLALEQSGSAAPKMGWLPQHLVLEDGNGGVAACMPLYLKSHSYGEYVFDHAWADAYMRAGGDYYPKLQCAVPFTPVTGRRLLVNPSLDRALGQRLLLRGAKSLTKQLDVSSFHATFLTEEEWLEAGTDRGFLQRTDQQFHWQNDAYASFDAFLDALASRKRKAIRKERREALASGIALEWITGDDLTEAHWDAFFAFYMDTGSRKWGTPYLTRSFFSLVGETMRDQILLVTAKRDGRTIAGALNFIGADTLYGRYWGTVEEHPFLHFETCYYQAIDFAIAHGLSRVEAGAQGAHKLARGYLPTQTYSVHYIADPALRQAVAKYLKLERRETAAEISMLAEESPFRKVGDSDRA